MKKLMKLILVATLCTVSSFERALAAGENLPPVADAGPDQIVIIDGSGTATAGLNGANSYDPEGLSLGAPDNGITEWIWAGDFAASPASGKNPAVVFATPGVKTVSLTVKDALGVESTDTLSITVGAPGPAILAEAQTVTVELDGNANFLQLSNYLESNGGAVAVSPLGGVSWGNNFSGETIPLPGAYQAFEVTFYATDLSGGISATTGYFIIEDTVGPQINWDVNGVAAVGGTTVIIDRKDQPGVVQVNPSDWSGAALVDLSIVSTTGRVIATVEGNTVLFDRGKKGNSITLRAQAVDGSGLLTTEFLTITIDKEKKPRR